MLGTSTASGNVSEEGKTCVIFTSRRSKVVAKVQGHARKSLFSQTNFAFAFKLSNYCANFSFKSALELL